MADVRAIIGTVAAFVHEGYVSEFGKPQVEMRGSFRVEQRVVKRTEGRKTGSRLWLDTGDIEEALSLWNSDFEAFATDQKALDDRVRSLL
jgi:hypothetical protein